MHMPYKQGFLKIDGTKHYVAIKGATMAYYKSENDFNFGKAVSRFVFLQNLFFFFNMTCQCFRL